MTKDNILLLLSFFTLTVSNGQKIGDYYVSIPSDGIQSYRLKFISDSIVELSSIPRHMSPSLKAVYKYVVTDSTIEISPELTNNQDSLSQDLHIHLPAIETKVTLTKIDDGFIDYNKSLIYVRQKDFGYSPNVAFIINGKTYIQDMGVTDEYGLIRKSPKTKKALQRNLKQIDIDKCNIEIVRGLNAYKRFGMKRVYGVIVITTEKNYR